MEKYFFVLGRYPEISLSEIQSVLKKNNLNNIPEVSSSEIAVFELSSGFDTHSVFKSLGGSIKYGIILGEVSLIDDQKDFQKYFESSYLIEKVIPQGLKKVHFGLSIYVAGAKREITKKLEENLLDFQLNIKNNLKDALIKAGFLRIKEKSLSSVAVEKNHLLQKGFELDLLALSEKIMIGKTQGVQDFESFARRDMFRPKKDKKSGILPVKLARMMVNLLPEMPRVILDPFCGSGTILMEAALLGVKKLIGTDIQKRAIDDTKTNLEWVIKQFNLNKNEFRFDLKTSDIRFLDKEIPKNSINAIVTEPFLGPPLFREPDEFQSQKIIKELTPLYSDSFKVFDFILSPGGVTVFIFPFFLSKVKNIFFDKNIIQPRSGGARFKILDSYNYSSPGQFVGREIVVLKKN